MRREFHLVEARREAISQMLTEQEKISVKELAAHFGTSAMTIRRDLQVLEEEGKLVHCHGFAQAVNAAEETSEQEELAAYREAISRYAAGFVRNGDVLFINGSSTALGILAEIKDRSVNVITNNGGCFDYTKGSKNHFFLIGGELHGDSRILCGDNAIQTLLPLHADRAFLGFAGISANGEVICDIPGEISINNLMANHCRELYLLLDHTKLGKTSSFASTSLERPFNLITDDKADKEIIAKLRRKGAAVHLVESERE